MTNQTRDYGDLRVTMTSSYTWKWDPSGNGSRRNVCLWHPNAQGNLKPLGTYANPAGYTQFNGTRASLLVGSNPNTNPSKPAVARPTDFFQIWTDRGAYGKHNGSIWRPIAPAGYETLGDVGQYNWDKPSVDVVWCVRSDLVGYGKFPAGTLWDDGGSGGYTDAYLWAIMPDDLGIEGSPNIPVVADTFRAQTTGERPLSGLCRILLLPVGKHYENFDAPVPEITPTTIPAEGQTFNFTEQCKVTLPFHCYFDPTHQSSLDHIRDPFCSVSRAAAWRVEKVWMNAAKGQLDREKRMLYGVSKEKREEMTHTVGLTVTASTGIKLSSYEVSLNYQFTYNSSSTFTEYAEKEMTEKVVVPEYYTKVLLSRHVWIKGSRDNGSVVLNQMEIVATDSVYYIGCDMPPKKTNSS